MKPRKHQAEFGQIIDGIINRQNLPGFIENVGILKTIILKVTPGGGKSFIPIVAGKLITAGLADAICWIVPRQALQTQGEAEFLDPFSRKLFSHDLMIRSSTNETNPCRSTNGFVTTYQALGIDEHRTVVSDFRKKRYILILDEYHHVAKGSLWHEALKPLYDMAAYVILMTGTLERGDEKEIAFTDYRNRVPYLENSETTSIIEYSRRDALAEQAILPISFHLSDGRFEWRDSGGDQVNINSFEAAKKSDQSAALYTALNTEFSGELLRESILHWQKHKKNTPRAKFLAVTADYKSAQEVTEMLKRSMGIHAEIATSHESKSAQQAIKRFKSSQLDILVTIAMAYEGLSVPPITHIACLTRIRSTPWIEQMIARAVRIDRQAGPYSSQRAHVFAPRDRAFVEIVKRIEHEQQAAVVRRAAPDYDGVEIATIPTEAAEGDGSGNGPAITPIGSNLTEISIHDLGGSEAASSLAEELDPVETVKEQELRLRQEIQKHVNIFCFENRYKQQQINLELMEKMGAPRELLPLSDLQRLQKWVTDHYPINRVLGTPIKAPPGGVSRARATRKRVSTKVVPWEGSKEGIRIARENFQHEKRQQFQQHETGEIITATTMSLF